MSPCEFLDIDQENDQIEERDALIERLAKIDKIEKKELVAKLESNLDTSLVYEHIKFLQKNIDKYDEMGAKIRDWTIGLWTGTLVAGYLNKTDLDERLWTIIWISIAIPIVMGIYDEIFKQFREKYKYERNILTEKFQQNYQRRSDIKFPEQLKKWQLITTSVKEFFNLKNPHVNFIYWLLIAVSILIAYKEANMSVKLIEYALQNLTSLSRIDML